MEKALTKIYGKIEENLRDKTTKFSENTVITKQDFQFLQRNYHTEYKIELNSLGEEK